MSSEKYIVHDCVVFYGVNVPLSLLILVFVIGAIDWDGYIMGDDFFVVKLYLFQRFLIDSGESFCSVSDDRPDRRFFLFGQMVTFLHRVLWSTLPRRILPKEDDWDSLTS